MTNITYNIIRECLAQIRGVRSLVQLNLKVYSTLPDEQKIQIVNNKLKVYEQKTQKILLDRKIAPPISTCLTIASLSVLGKKVLNLDNNGRQMFLSMQNSQEWANNSIRQLNQHQLQQNQVRQILIGFRNTLQNYTLQKNQLKSTAQSPISKLLKFII